MGLSAIEGAGVQSGGPPGIAASVRSGAGKQISLEVT